MDVDVPPTPMPTPDPNRSRLGRMTRGLRTRVQSIRKTYAVRFLQDVLYSSAEDSYLVAFV